MSKPFNISPNQVKVVFILNDITESAFLSFLFSLGTTYVERDLGQWAAKLEPYGIILIKDNDSRLEKLFAGMYEIWGGTYYYVGTNYLLKPEHVDIFNKNIFVGKSQWTEFNLIYKNQYGQTFEELLKEIK